MRTGVFAQTLVSSKPKKKLLEINKIRKYIFENKNTNGKNILQHNNKKKMFNASFIMYELGLQ